MIYCSSIYTGQILAEFLVTIIQICNYALQHIFLVSGLSLALGFMLGLKYKRKNK